MASEPPSTRPVDATRCMTCPVGGDCIGGVAAHAGTRQLQSVLAGRALLRAGETLHQQAFSLSVVRSGSLVSSAPVGGAARRPGFHYPGQAVGTGRALRLVALEDTELCVMRPGAGFALDPDGRACHGRLWDMLSRALLRERALANAQGSRG